MITPEIKYDYEYNDNLELRFNFPAGIGSFSEDEEEIKKDYPELVEICEKANLDINDAIQLTMDIDDIIYENLGNSISIDWRDVDRMTIRNIHNIPKLIDELKDIANTSLPSE